MGESTDKIAGRIKQAAGDLTDNEELTDEGETQEAAGKAKGVIDDVAGKLGDAVDSIRKKLD